MKSEEFDKLFDEGKDITHLLDMSTARRPNQELKRVNVDFPIWMVKQLDQESKRLPFALAEPGIAGLETLLPLSLALYHAGQIGLLELLSRLTVKPA